MVLFPSLVAFDLDGTIWSPDMYMLWGGGAPFTPTSPSSLSDRSGQVVSLLGSSAEILSELKGTPGVDIAWASCTDEPTWAEECLGLFQEAGGMPLRDLVEPRGRQIFKADKKRHFERLKDEFNVGYEDMLFFDNEPGNVRSVGSIGVCSILCEDGMTR